MVLFYQGIKEIFLLLAVGLIYSYILEDLTLRLLMSYIYIYIYGAPILDVWCVVVCDLETSRMGAPYIYIYDISSLKVNDLTLILLTWRK